ncbi:Mitochondrial distribution and morphology protein 10 [Pseudogymnoascus australis]
MLEFMDFVQQSFYNASRWSYENNYTNLTATSRALLDFDTPRGFRVDISSLSSPNFATSYALGSVGLVNGSLSYLYTSLPLTDAFEKAGRLNLHDVIRGYRQIQDLPSPTSTWPPASSDPSATEDIIKPPTLLYGRLYLPQSTLEALYLRRLSPTSQIKISAVSSSRLRNGGTILALHQHDVGKYSTEALYSTDGGLLGLKGLYNFGPDPRVPATSASASTTSSTGVVATTATPTNEDRIHGRFSAGAEAYYGTLNKSGGVSLGGRFATLPTYRGIPLTATLTLNPLMGNFSATYAVKAGEDLALCSRFEFNAYSYESELVLGCELWRRSFRLPVRGGRSMAAKLAWLSEEEMFPLHRTHPKGPWDYELMGKRKRGR